MDPAALWIRPATIELRRGADARPGLQINLPGTPRGAVLVLGRADVADGHVATVMNSLAAHGYEAVGVDVPHDAAGLSDDDLDAWTSIGLERLAGGGWTPEQVGLIGYGTGGHASLVAATRRALGAAVSVSPRWTGDPTVTIAGLARRAGEMRTPWLGLVGGKDTAAPTPALRELAVALDDRAAVFTRVVVYRGVDGAFHHDAAESPVHAAAFDAWQRIVEWVDLRVVPRPTRLAAAWSAARASSAA